MITKEKFSSLIHMDMDRRIFILVAMEYIEKCMTEILYNNDYWNQDVVRINFEDIFFNVFASEEVDNKRIVTGWIANKHIEREIAVPEDFMGKSWKELKPDYYESSMLKWWLESLEKVLRQNLDGWKLRINWFEDDMFSEKQCFKFL